MHLPPILAAVLYFVGIAGLFWLDRNRKASVSKALWIPTVWLMLSGTKPLSMWLGMAPTEPAATVYVEGSPLERAVFISLEVTALVILLNRAPQASTIIRKNWPIVLFFSYAAISILWSDYPFITFKHWIKGLGDVAMVLVVLTEPDVTEAIARLVKRAGFTLVPLSLLLCKYYPNLGRTVDEWNGAIQWVGVSGNKNTLGGLCLVYGLGLLWSFSTVYKHREDPSRRSRLLALGTVLGMTIWLLWKSKSLTCLCAFVMAGAVMVLSARPFFRRQPAFVHLLVVVMLSTAVYAIFFQSSGAIVEGLGKDPTLTGRTKIWSAVLSEPINPVVGAGYESFWLGRRLQRMWTRFRNLHLNEAHNGYIEMYLTLGWIGISLLSVIIVFGYRAASAESRSGSDMGGLCLAWLLAAVIRGLAEAAFRFLSSSWIFFVLAVMAASRATYEAAEPSDFAEREPEADFVLTN